MTIYFNKLLEQKMINIYDLGSENFEGLDIEDLRQKAKCLPLIVHKDTKLVVYVGRLMELKTPGGIILTDANIHDISHKKTRGLVMDVAYPSKEEEEKSNLSVGNVVCFRPFEGIHKPGRDKTYGFRLLTGYEIQSIETN